MKKAEPKMVSIRGYLSRADMKGWKEMLARVRKLEKKTS